MTDSKIDTINKLGLYVNTITLSDDTHKVLQATLDNIVKVKHKIEKSRMTEQRVNGLSLIHI